jgi:hypothetical protein
MDSDGLQSEQKQDGPQKVEGKGRGDSRAQVHACFKCLRTERSSKMSDEHALTS